MIRELRLVVDPAVEILRQVVAGHHENLDGSGYPIGLKAEKISLEPRLVVAADIYDSLSQVRPCRPALPIQQVEEILQEIARRGQIDGECLEVLFSRRE